MGRGVLGTGGGTASGLEPTSGLGGGMRLLCGSGAEVRGPEGGPGKRGGPLGGEKGLAAVERPPGGRAGGRGPGPPASADTGEGISVPSDRGLSALRHCRHQGGSALERGAQAPWHNPVAPSTSLGSTGEPLRSGGLHPDSAVEGGPLVRDQSGREVTQRMRPSHSTHTHMGREEVVKNNYLVPSA